MALYSATTKQRSDVMQVAYSIGVQILLIDEQLYMSSFI